MQISGPVHVSPQLSSFLPSALERLTSGVVDFLRVVVNQGAACLPSGGCSACRRGSCENSLAPRARPRRPARVPGAGARGVGVGRRGLCSSPGSLQRCRWGYTSEGLLGDGQAEILGDKRENVSVHFLLVPDTTASIPKNESNLSGAGRGQRRVSQEVIF